MNFMDNLEGYKSRPSMRNDSQDPLMYNSSYDGYFYDGGEDQNFMQESNLGFSTSPGPGNSYLRNMDEQYKRHSEYNKMEYDSPDPNSDIILDFPQYTTNIHNMDISLDNRYPEEFPKFHDNKGFYPENDHTKYQRHDNLIKGRNDGRDPDFGMEGYCNSLQEESFDSVTVCEPDYDDIIQPADNEMNYITENQPLDQKKIERNRSDTALPGHGKYLGDTFNALNGDDTQSRQPRRGDNLGIIDDGNKTLVVRKKSTDFLDDGGHRMSRRRHSTIGRNHFEENEGRHHSTIETEQSFKKDGRGMLRRQSTIGKKRVISEGYVPSHKSDILTLKDKIKMIREQDSLHGLVDVFREKILQEPELQLKGFDGWRYRQLKKWNAFKEQLQNIASVLELWAGSFRTIEGRFGTAIMNYFRFIRWLMFMNLYMAVIMICVTLVPQLILTSSPINQTIYNQTLWCTDQYENHLQNIMDKEDIGNKVLDILQGTGWMEQTVLFYGIYQNKTVMDGHTNYNMSLAYLLALGAAFLISFFLIVRNTGKGLKQGVLNKESSVNLYTNKVFCGGWDFCINERKAAKRRHKNFFQELKGDLETQRLIWRKQSRTLKDKVKLYAIRIVVNVFVLAALSGSLYLIYYTNETMLQLQDDNFTDFHAIVQALVQYLPSITITLLNVVVPIIFVKLVTFEDYTPAFEIKVTLLRIILLRLASLGILIASLYKVIDSTDDTVSNCGNTRWNDIHHGNFTDNQLTSSIKCWETYVGQQIYKLIIMDFLVGVVTTFAVEFPRRLVYKKFHKTNKLIKLVGQQEFDLPKVVLDIVYSQTLCWMGLFFCPLTPVLGFLKCLIFFYVRKISLLKNCVQPVRPYRTSRSNSLFAAVLFLSFLLSTLPLAYLISSFHPSQSCGPFRQYNETDYVFYDTIPNVIKTWPSTAVEVFKVIGSYVFLIPAILLVCSVMYTYWAAKEAGKREAELLEEKLTEEGRDKQFLLAQVNEILQHLDTAAS